MKYSNANGYLLSLCAGFGTSKCMITFILGVNPYNVGGTNKLDGDTGPCNF